jgi:methionine-rich copper-binding protein CopC
MDQIKNLILIAATVFVAHQTALAHDGKIPPRPKKNTVVQQIPAQYQRGSMGMTSVTTNVQMIYEFVNSAVDADGLLTLKIARKGGGDAATLELRADAEISLPVGLPTPQAQFNEGDAYVVKVKPAAQGLHYINVFLRSNQATEAKAIAVQIGNQAAAHYATEAPTVPGARRMISVPLP